MGAKRNVRTAAIVSLLLSMAMLPMARTAWGASFDCAKAKTDVEKMICADEELSKLDDEMAATYRAALQNKTQASSIRKAQRQWLKERDACNDADCVRQAYRTQLAASQKTKSSRRGGSWTYHWDVGENKPLCGDLLRRLNSYEWNESQNSGCSWHVLATYPEFSDPPWEDIDPKSFEPGRYEDLVFRVEKYSNEGPASYFHRLPGLKEHGPDSLYREWAKNFIKDGGKLQVWRTKISAFNGSTTWKMRSEKKERTLVRMVYAYPKLSPRKRDEIHNKRCKNMPKADKGSIVYMTPDLSDPDLDVDDGTFRIIASSDVKLYRSVPVFVSTIDIWQDTPIGLDALCFFGLNKGGE